jgi:hypothetical protein
MNSGHLRDFNSGAQGIQDEIYIDFSEPMDESGLLGAISTRVIGGKGTSFPQGTWIYEKEQKRLRFVLNEGASFVDSTKYEVTITSEAKDLAGNPLDGNRNGVVEGELDKVHIFFYTDGGENVPDPDYYPPVFDGIFQNLISPSPLSLDGEVMTTDSLHIRFYTLDIDHNSVSGAFSLTEYESGNPVNLGTPQIIEDGNMGYTDIIFKGFSLNYKTVYKVYISTSLKDENGNTLSGDGDSYSEAEEIDHVEFVFATVKNANGEKTEFPEFGYYHRLSWNRGVIKIYFDRYMDKSTINTQNIKVFNNNYQDLVPFELNVYDDVSQQVTYAELRLLGSKGDPVNIWLSKELKSSEGVKFDGDGDGIGGIKGKDNKIVFVP